MQHAGVELEHVVDVHSHKVLCQVSLEVDRNRRIHRYITNTTRFQSGVDATDCEGATERHSAVEDKNSTHALLQQK